MTLLAVYNSDGCVGRCDAKCHEAECVECTCICGGANHGVGRQKAIENTRAMADKWIEKWVLKHPDHYIVKNAEFSQLSLF